MAKLILWLNAAVFAGFGVACALWPAGIAELTTGAIPASTSAMTDFRAVYGGMMIGIGLLLALTTRNDKTVRIGLQAVFLILICMAVTRTMGLLIDGSPNQYMLLYLVAEAAMAALAGWLLTTDKA